MNQNSSLTFSHAYPSTHSHPLVTMISLAVNTSMCCSISLCTPAVDTIIL